MSKPLRVEDAARNELRAIVAWYEDRRSGLGGEFFGDVERTLQLIERHPQLGVSVPRVAVERGTRRLPLGRFPYTIVYRETEVEIQIIAFAHNNRKPGYWSSR
ncbi:MAG TPA: type II toxin-antitoxin system RelE/ParE family toxin [Candidatus Binatia bacterium]|nr:type II toxin-antitoxin system RelE/ParE family toxin [Candidatus Binatia bacterium]